MRAFKYVDLKDAEAVSRGSLRIGTFDSYSVLEDETRRDTNEATVIREQGFYDLFRASQDPDLVAHFRRFGMNIQGATSGFCAYNTFINRCEPLFCFCMSNSINPTLSSAGPQAIFEVKGVRALAALLLRKHPSVFKAKKVGKVVYLPRVVDWLDNTSLPNPFIKDTRFSLDDECRICWLPRQSKIDCFNTPEDVEIADLLRRID